MKFTPAHRLFLRLVWIFGVVVVVIATLLPPNSLPIRELASLDINDKIEHFGAYAAIALLPAIHESRKFLLTAVLGLILMGVLLEYGQMVTGRDFEVLDMVADAAGVLLGVVIGLSIRNKLVSEA